MNMGLNAGWAGLNAAESSLDDLMVQFPAVLNMIPQSIKSDIKSVNGVMAHICNKIASDTRPNGGFSYYSVEGMKSTCESINSMANGLSQAIEGPEFTQYYVDQLKGTTKSFKDTVASFGF